MATATLDYSGLTAPVSAADLDSYKAAEKSKPNYRAGAGLIQAILVVFIIGFFGLILIGFLFTGIGIVVSATEGGAPIGLAELIIPLVLAVVFGVVVWVMVRAILRGGNHWNHSYRLDRFARANGFVFSRFDADPQYPGDVQRQEPHHPFLGLPRALAVGPAGRPARAPTE